MRSKSHWLRRLPAPGLVHGPKPLFLVGKVPSVYPLTGPKAPPAFNGPCWWVAPLLSLLTLCFPNRHFHLPRDPKIPQAALSMALAQILHPPFQLLGTNHVPCSCGEGPWCWLGTRASPVPFQLSVSSLWLHPEAAGALFPVAEFGRAGSDGQRGIAWDRGPGTWWCWGPGKVMPYLL